MRPCGVPDNRELNSLRIKLLHWFDSHRRDLPWRKNRDAYRIWVSEVMLQQTTVAAVIPYFERFVTTLPSLESLAAADEQQVLKLWEGLGYYRRARHLHAAARQLVATHHGRLPNDPTVWANLPGVGRYILGAVLSQAFDRRLPIVEANSLRVLTRLFGFRGDPREKAGKVWVWAAAEAVLPQKRSGDFNQALMELGALICKPTAPACGQCPLSTRCAARQSGLQETIPPRKKPPTVVAVDEVGIVIRKGRRVLLCQRSAVVDRWQNMWEIPHALRRPNETLNHAARRVARELTGISVEPGAEVLTVKHGVTRHAISLTCVAATRCRGSFVPGFYVKAEWVLPEELTEYPVSSPQRTLLTVLTNPNRQKRSG